MGLFRCDSGFSLSLQFPDIHSVMGFFCLVELWIVGRFWNWVRSQENSQGLGVKVVYSLRIPQQVIGERQIPQGISEETVRHPRLFWAL